MPGMVDSDTDHMPPIDVDSADETIILAIEFRDAVMNACRQFIAMMICQRQSQPSPCAGGLFSEPTLILQIPNPRVGEL